MRRIRKQSGGLFSRRTRKHGGSKRRVWRKIHIHCRATDALCEPKVRAAKLLGQRLMARGFERQVAEFQARVAVLNGFTAIGMPVTEAVG